jgi:hypothetical protein
MIAHELTIAKTLKGRQTWIISHFKKLCNLFYKSRRKLLLHPSGDGGTEILPFLPESDVERTEGASPLATLSKKLRRNCTAELPEFKPPNDAMQIPGVDFCGIFGISPAELLMQQFRSLSLSPLLQPLPKLPGLGEILREERIRENSKVKGGSPHEKGSFIPASDIPDGPGGKLSEICRRKGLIRVHHIQKVMGDPFPGGCINLIRPHIKIAVDLPGIHRNNLPMQGLCHPEAPGGFSHRCGADNSYEGYLFFCCMYIHKHVRFLRQSDLFPTLLYRETSGLSTRLSFFYRRWNSFSRKSAP